MYCHHAEYVALSYVDPESVKLISVFEGRSAMSSVIYERFKCDALVIVPGSLRDSADTSTGSPLDSSVGTGAGSNQYHVASSLGTRPQKPRPRK